MPGRIKIPADSTEIPRLYKEILLKGSDIISLVFIKNKQSFSIKKKHNPTKESVFMIIKI